jgi:Na+-translocating ferredoxin:NAD+ oxidoreductase RnfE subunit
MSEQTQISPTPPPTSNQEASPPPAAVKKMECNGAVQVVIALCGLGIIGSFFLPWIVFFGSEPSGYQLQQIQTNEVKLLWLIPASAFIALVAAIAKQSVRTASQFAGIAPFLALLYYVMKFGQDIIKILRPGAYLTLFLGAVLLVAPYFLKKAKQ